VGSIIEAVSTRCSEVMRGGWHTWINYRSCFNRMFRSDERRMAEWDQLKKLFQQDVQK